MSKLIKTVRTSKPLLATLTVGFLAAGFLLVSEFRAATPTGLNDVLVEYTQVDKVVIEPTTSLFGKANITTRLYGDSESGLFYCGKIVEGDLNTQHSYKKTNLPPGERDNLLTRLTATGLTSGETTEEGMRIGAATAISFTKLDGSKVTHTYYGGEAPAAFTQAESIIEETCQKASGSYEAKKVAIRSERVPAVPEGTVLASWNSGNVPLGELLAAPQVIFTDEKAARVRNNFGAKTELYVTHEASTYHLSILQILPGDPDPTLDDGHDTEEGGNPNDGEEDAEIPQEEQASRKNWLARLGGFFSSPAQAYHSYTSYEKSVETDFINRINSHRTNSHSGIGGLNDSECLTEAARHHSAHMAREGKVFHSSSVSRRINEYCNGNWAYVGENVGMGQNAEDLQRAFLKSSRHHSNIHFDPYNVVGVGVVADHGMGDIYATQLFARCISSCASKWTLTPTNPVQVSVNTVSSHNYVTGGQNITYRITVDNNLESRVAYVLENHIPAKTTRVSQSRLNGGLTARDRSTSTSGTQYYGYKTSCFGNYTDAFDGISGNGCPHYWWSFYVNAKSSGYVEFTVSVNNGLPANTSIIERVRARHYYRGEWREENVNRTQNFTPQSPRIMGIGPDNAVNTAAGQLIKYRYFVDNISGNTTRFQIESLVPANATAHYMDVTASPSNVTITNKGFNNTCFSTYTDSSDGVNGNGCPHPWWQLTVPAYTTGYVDFWVKVNQKDAIAGNQNDTDAVPTVTMNSTAASNACVTNEALISTYVNGAYRPLKSNRVQNCIRTSTDTTTPSVPINVTVTPGNLPKERTIVIKWSPSSDNVGVVGYKIYRKNPGSSSFTHIHTTTSTSYTDRPLKACNEFASPTTQEYSYYVVSYDATGRTSTHYAEPDTRTLHELNTDCVEDR